MTTKNTTKKLYEYKGSFLSLKEISKEIDLPYKTLWCRIKAEMPLAKAFSHSIERKKTKRNPEKTVQKICNNCSSLFVIPKCNNWRENSCSSDCKKEYRYKISQISKQNRTVNCLFCSKSFVARQNQLDAGQGKFCSLKCSTEANKASTHTAQAIKKRNESRKKSIAEGRVILAVGCKHHSWTGGKEMAELRRQEKAIKMRDSGENARRLREYRKANPEFAREARDRRKGRLTERLPRGTVKRLGDLQKWKCVICRIGISNRYHVDHINPLARGGQHEPNNIQLLCPSCNVRKSAKDPIKYMQERGYLL